MSRHLEWLLISWSLLAFCWWGIALWLVFRERRKTCSQKTGGSDAVQQNRPTLSIFKPIPSLHGAAPSSQLVGALESFVSQLTADTEMLLGIEDTEALSWEPVIAKWRQTYTEAKLNVIVAPRPAQFRSPKVSWFHHLARYADGEVWLWSDADIVAPARSLDAMRREFSESDAGMLTSPYVVRNAGSAPMMLEALFANMEFYPGVLFCRQMGPVRFGLGPAMMFSAARFRERAQWEKLGARMADDNALGRALAPVKISETTVATFAAESTWRDAVQHYFRWKKTVRWCQPAGFAGLIIIQPTLGWLLAILMHPLSAVAWLGFVATGQVEVLTAATLFWLIGCELRSWSAVILWSLLLRPLTWVACWMPWPVVFRSQKRKWWSLYHSVPLEGES
ncbi:MAG TPA: glycosyltransferase family 2 protein [Verrucomicrobiae bacterium]|nr:glycosyltransferase family 2 protein [Verrucomicrobiae bacterium]